MHGMTSVEAADQLKQHGANRLQPATQRAVVLQFLAHFKKPLVLVLIAYLLAVEEGKQWFYQRLMKA